MLKNYLTIAYRNLLKNRLASGINLIGLSVAVAVAIVVYLFIDTYLHMDDFHVDGDRIFLVENVIDRDGRQQVWGDTPRPLGPRLEADAPQVERAVRMQYGGGTFQVGETVLSQGFWFVDPAFLEVLTFPLRYGEAGVLDDPQAIVLSTAAAERYFGQENPLGREVEVTFNDEVRKTFVVRAVAEPFPNNASFSFNALIAFDHQRDLGVDLDDWGHYTSATFIRLQQPGDAEAVLAQIETYRPLQNAASSDWPIAAFRLDALPMLARHSFDVQGDPSMGMHPAALVTLPLIGLFLLILACFNYMNIAVATATRRLKEIGVRKVVGGRRRQLVAQFLSENILLCLLALVAGIVLARFLLLPAFNDLDVFDVDLVLSLGANLRLWVFLVGLLVVTGVVSGAYPAFYVSSFSPATIFRGQQAVGGAGRFTQVFLTFQFALAFLTMITGVVLAMNARYQEERDWGYAQEHVLGVQLQEGSQYAALEQTLRQDPRVLEVAGGRHHVGRGRSMAVVEVRGEQKEVTRFDVGTGYFEAVGLRLKAGRVLDEAHGGDASGAIVVNETFARAMEWDEPVGQQVRDDSLALTVVGVVEDFHYDDFFDPIGPTLFRLAAPDDYRYLVARVEAGAGAATAESIEKTWRGLYPDLTYNGFFQDAVFDYYFRVNTDISRIFTFTAFMALLLSCMGLFGLAAQHVARRMKEISIRKVLGASLLHVASLVNRRFLLLLAVAAVVATPASYYLVSMLLDSVYAYRMELGAGPFLLSYALVLATALLTVSALIRRVATANPAEVLRNE